MVSSSRLTLTTNPRLSVQEAYNLWDILASRYMIIEQLTLWDRFAHDADLRLHIGNVKSQMSRVTGSWEKTAMGASIKGPDAARKGVNTSMNSEVFHDEQIALWLLRLLQEDLQRLFRVARTCATNDGMRRKATREIRRMADYQDDLVKYLKLKGWINSPPLYPNVPRDTPEELSCAEASHLWDHLTFRYDNIDENRTWRDAVHDGDFRLILDVGLALLSRQIKRLEKEVLHFGLPLPKAPPKVHAMLENTNFTDDDTIFRLLLSGLQGAVLLHVRAFTQSTVNDRIRTLFKQLLFSEMGLAEKMLLYGKVKGWLNPAPQYMP